MEGNGAEAGEENSERLTGVVRTCGVGRTEERGEQLKDRRFSGFFIGGKCDLPIDCALMHLWMRTI